MNGTDGTTRREFLCLLGAGAGAGLAARAGLLQAAENAPDPAAPPSAVTRKTPPNILFVHADDLKADTAGALGNKEVKTPVFDGLAQRGVVFTRVYTMGSMVGAVCLPSRIMLLSGRTLFRIPHAGVKADGILPVVLRGAGYETYHIGKSGNEYTAGIEAFDHNITRNDPGKDRARSSEAHADAVIKFLRGRKADKPFFVYLAPPVPHDPRVAPEEFRRMYDPAGITLPASFQPVHPFDNGEMTVRDECLAPWPRTKEEIRKHLADYYACVSCLDHHVGRILDCLRGLGQLDNTVVVVSGDNGLSLGDHGLMGKQNLYEFGGMHVPLIVAGPGVPPGSSDALVYLLDLLPTFCEMAGVAPPPSAEGRSLVPVLQGKQAKTRDALFTAYGHCQRAIRDTRWKLIRYPLVDKTQLFDLQNDPRELNDLADKPEQAGRVKELMALLAEKQKEFNDPDPLTVPNPKPARWTPPAKPAKPGKAREGRGADGPQR